MRWVLTLFLFIGLFCQNGLGHSQTAWDSCFHAVAANSAPDDYRFLYLPPHSKRGLVSVLAENDSAEWLWMVSDYIGSHEMLLTTLSVIDLFDESRSPHHLERVVHGGEVLLENPTDGFAIGQITSVNVTSRFMKEMQSPSRRGFARTRFSNDPHQFVRVLRDLRPDLVAPQVVVYETFEAKPHLLGYAPSDMRHGFTGTLIQLAKMATARQQLGETLKRDSKTILQTEEILKQIDWVIPHVGRQLSKPSYYCARLPQLMRQWRTGVPMHGDNDWKPLVENLKELELDVKDLAERSQLIPLGKY